MRSSSGLEEASGFKGAGVSHESAALSHEASGLSCEFSGMTARVEEGAPEDEGNNGGAPR